LVFRSLPRAFSPVLSIALALALPLAGSSARAADPAALADDPLGAGAPAVRPAELRPPQPARPRVMLEPGWLTLEPATGRRRLVAGVPAEAAEDDAIERVYTGRFRLEGAESATGLRIVIEIPRGLHYVAGSATGPRAEISFSADGGRSFGPPDELAVTTDYTHIRWDLPGEFAPGTAGLVTFRARPATLAATGVAP